jgi:hypothetical protein
VAILRNLRTNKGLATSLTFLAMTYKFSASLKTARGPGNKSSGPGITVDAVRLHQRIDQKLALPPSGAYARNP